MKRHDLPEPAPMPDENDVPPDVHAFLERFGDPDGAPLLDDIADWLGRYLSVPSEHCITVFTLWAAHTHITEQFYVTPRLIVDSAEPMSGKTRVLELLNLICRAPIFTMNTTIAALYRRLVGEPRTILLDETDAIFAKGAAQNHEDLRALLNAGYKRGATVDRCVPKGNDLEVREFPAFAPAALAGITGNMPETVTSRSVTVHMRRTGPDEQLDEYIEEDVLEEAIKLREPLVAWLSGLSVRGARPSMPAGVRDRKAEVWRALLAVADAAGGHWPERARAACRHFALGAGQDDAVSIGVRLLTDIYAVWECGIDGEPVSAMSTERLLAKLHALDEAPWGDWYGKPFTPRSLAKTLKPYGVKSKVVRIGDETARGYTRESLWDPWSRYGVLSPGVCVTDVTSATPQVRHVTHDKSEASQAQHDVTHVTHGESVRNALTSGVTHVTPVTHTPRTPRVHPGNRTAEPTPCAVCDQPMTLVEPGQTTHPTCNPEGDMT